MGWYYYFKKLHKEFHNRFFIVLVCGTFFGLFLISNFTDNEARPKFTGRQNAKWRLGNRLGVSTDVLDSIFKTRMGYYRLDRSRFSEEIEGALKYPGRGILINSIQRQDRLSVIKDFICAGSASEYNALCGRTLFHHTCSYDDASSRDPVKMIKTFAEGIPLLSPEIGRYMYFDLDIENYDCQISRRNLCLQDLIIDPLKRFSSVSSDMFLIVVNFVEDCQNPSDLHTVTILQILDLLSRELPSQFKFILISRGWMKNDLIDGAFGHLPVLDMYKGLTTGKSLFVSFESGPLFTGSNMMIGYCMDSMEVLLLTVLLGCSFFIELSPIYRDPYAVLIFSYFVKLSVVLASLLAWIIMVFLCYVYFTVTKMKTEYEHKDWFHRLNLFCDNIHIHCMIDQRLERKYHNLRTIYRKESIIESLVDSSLTKKSVKDLQKNSLLEFELSLAIQMEGSRNQNRMRNLLINATKRKFSILCRWLMLNTIDNGRANQEIERSLNIAFGNVDRHTAKAIAWTITKAFFQTFVRNLADVTNIFPAIQCECKDKSSIRKWLCSEVIYLVIISECRVTGVPRRYKGFKIKKKYERKNDLEGDVLSKKLQDRLKDSVMLRNKISRNFVENLFRNHTNLSLICNSPYRSSSFGSTNHTIKDEICFQLYCLAKGMIPIGEEHFPITIHNFPTDVLEGRAFLISNLHIGEKIGTQSSTGTLGGFVHYLNFDCFLTCAHVMYDSQTLLTSPSNFALLPGSTAYTHVTQPPTEVGKVMWRAFEHDDKFRTSIDAALVLLQNNATIDPNDYIKNAVGHAYHFSNLGLRSPYINESFVDPEDVCGHSQQSRVVAAGARTQIEDTGHFPKRSEIEVLFDNLGQTAAQINGNAFFPLVISSPAHMQLSSGPISQSPRRTFVMYNQMVINNLHLKSGDSGTCIYIIQHPEHKNGCIGMAIAFCSGVTVVTPVKDILQRINS